MTIDKEQLLKSRLGEADVEIPGVGTVRVRALNRDEAFKMKGSDDPLVVERRMIAAGMVSPEMTVDEVKAWQIAAPAGELEPVSDKIAELSGMTSGAAKEAYLEMEQDPDAEFRDVPGPEAGDDADPVEG